MFRFTIRDVLWLTVVVAMGVAWWMEHDVKRKTIVLWKLRATTAARLMEQTGWKVNWKKNGGATFDGHGQRLDVGAPSAWNLSIK